MHHAFHPTLAQAHAAELQRLAAATRSARPDQPSEACSARRDIADRRHRFTRGRAAALVAAAGLAVVLAAAAPAAAGTRFDGRWTCVDRGAVLPLGGAQVELVDRGLVIFGESIGARVVARGRTGADGRFSLTSPHDGGEYVVRAVLRDVNQVHLKDWFSPWDWFTDSPAVRGDTGVREMGDVAIRRDGGGSPQCAAWRGVSRAFDAFMAESGGRRPLDDLLIRGDAPSAGVPYTSHTAINWSPGASTGPDPVEASVATHEFAHAVRHGFDGDVVHFARDVVRFGYLQRHELCSRTNEGFAFNEGWAEYWAGEVTGPINCAGVGFRADDMRIEGNVAAALVALQRRCRMTRVQMAEVLRRAPGWIHSFADFRAFASPCRPETAPPVDSASDQPVEVSPVRPPQLAPDATRDHVREVIRGLNQNRQSIIDDERGARRDMRVIPRCPEHCMDALRERIAPAVLAGRRDVVQAWRRAVTRVDSLREMRLYDERTKGGRRRSTALRRTLVVALRGAERTMIRRALRAARPVLRVGDATVRRHVLALRTRLRALRSPRASAITPALPMAVRTDHTVLIPQATAPDPQAAAPDAPQPDPPAAAPAPGLAPAAIDLVCPGKAQPNGTPVSVSGSLAPPHAAAPITLTYTHSSGLSESHSVQTDDKGAFGDQFKPPTSGGWTVEAAFPGDADHAAATATCTLAVGG